MHGSEASTVQWRVRSPENGLAPRKYDDELRERAHFLVREAREQEPALSLNAAVLRFGRRVGANPDTLGGPVQAGRRRPAPGRTTTPAATTKQLQAESASSSAQPPGLAG